MPLLAIGGFSAATLGMVAITIGVMLAVMAVVGWCQEHGCTMPEFDVLGVIRGLTLPGRTEFMQFIAAQVYGRLNLVGVCALTADAADGRLASELALGCPGLPDEDKDCVKERVQEVLEEFLTDHLIELIQVGLKGALATGASEGLGDDVSFASAKKKRCANEDDDEETKWNRPDGKCYGIDDEWFFKEFAEMFGKDWQVLMDKAEAMKAPYGYDPPDDACIDWNGDVFADLGRGRFEHLGNVLW